MKYLKYVNALQGTKNHPRFSNGNILPLTQLPFAMASFAPQTSGANQWWFDPTLPSVEGIRLTHQPSPWINDYGTLLFAPGWGVKYDDAQRGWSGYRVDKAQICPDYINIRFLRSRAEFELVPTVRGAVCRISFDEKNSFVSVYNVFGCGEFFADRENKVIYGVTDGNKAGGAKDFKMHIALRPKNDWIDFDNIEVVQNGGEKAVLHIGLKKDETIAEFDIGISYISRYMALANCEDLSFDEAHKAAVNDWEDYLSKIEIESENEEELKTFYSCMYRTGLYPHCAYETDEKGNAVHYSPYTGEVHPGVRYTDNGFWDTFRTVLPLYSIIYPRLYREFMLSLLGDYKEGGWIPRWTAMGESGCMPSTLTDSVIAQGILCDIVDYDTGVMLLEGMLNHAENVAPESRFGRNGIKEYKELGYVPSSYKESVNLTLDFAYGDYCIAQVMKKLGKTEREAEYRKRALNYRNIFDADTGFMRARDDKGNMKDDFDPCAWGGDSTEASAWQTTLFVPHDTEGLAQLMGGRDVLIGYLDKLFSSAPEYHIGAYGGEIHEMTEMAAIDCGLCSINNQPSFSIPYIYAYLGFKEKTEGIVKDICNKYFNSGIEGYPGDEDNGSMSAWYILGMIGLYPYNPGGNMWINIKSQVKGKICGIDIEEIKKKF